LLAQLHCIGVVYETYTYKGRKDADWSKLTATQRAVIAWLEDDSG